MEMTRAYMEETVGAMCAAVFSGPRRDAPPTRSDGTVLYHVHRFHLVRTPSEEIVLECLVYPDGHETYWLELCRILTISAMTFGLDSWKLWPDRIEFRYYGRGDGAALTFVLQLSASSTDIS